MKKVARHLIVLYKKTLSPAISANARCIYTPTCSMYMLDAIERYGCMKGIGMGILRLLRCNPFAKGGFDPVKENLKGTAKWTL